MRMAFARREVLAGLAAAPAMGFAPAGAEVRETIEGRPTLRNIPRKPVGLVYLFHGTGGSEAFATRRHTRILTGKLLARGYGVAAAPSGRRTAPVQWDLGSVGSAENADIAYMLALHETLIRRGEIERATPVFTTGMSNGGGFANVFGVGALRAGLPVRAIADYMGPIPAAARPPAVAARDYPPMFLVLGENDGLVSAQTVGDVARSLAEAGATVELHQPREQAVSPATFGVIEGLGDEARRAIFQGLVDAAVLDAAGRRLVFRDRPVLGRPEMAELARMIPAGPHSRDVMDELLIAWSAHQMRSDFADAQLRFFERHRGR
ncbi:MAG: hypothetical protein JNK30_00965 [Phenylobacterium sp.]|uniref:hypothetical protein n=1 Tax=Phenylobacterium sp. TaxID=1871053 RepID=UPI001A4F8B54|nr:hypothetical protein [Phenylobacterium sp.]MBL8769925.1 hypothetical protein [Phenylobacterium sp.]